MFALPAQAQVTNEELERCSGLRSGAAVPAEARIGYCTRLIDGGQLTRANLESQVNQLKALIDVCHVYDIAVLFDVVYNHAGPLDDG